MPRGAAAGGGSKKEERLISPRLREEDLELDRTLRPRTLADYIGQSHAKESLSLFVEAARRRNEPLDHVLLYGPPGLGKTTLAGCIAHELGVAIRMTSGPAIERQGDLVALLTNLKPRDVLFIDEIHRLSRVIEEVLYPAMEDFAVDIMIGKGPGARSVRLELAPFTLIGATTRAGMLTSPLRDRFGVILRLDFYSFDELKAIVQRSGALLSIQIDDGGATEIARRARGTPRTANRLLRRVRDYAQVRAGGRITQDVACQALQLLDVDERGLDAVDRQLLSAIVEKFDGGPVGVETLAAAIGEEAETIEDVYEPFLMQQGFLQRTPRGRVATRLAGEILGLAGRGEGSGGRGRPAGPDAGQPAGRPHQSELFER